MMLKLLLIVAGSYVLLVLLAASFQARLLFPTFAVGRPGLLPASVQRLAVNTPDGDRLVGVHIPPGDLPAERLLVVVFAGNAWNAEDAADLVHHIWPGADVVAFHYRGYSPSTGSPSAASLLADAPLVVREAKARVPSARTIAVGFSVGSGVAARLAGSGKVDAAVLVTPFDRLRRVAEGHYRFLPVRLFFRHDIDAAAALARSDVPIALISAEKDTIIPPERTVALRRSAGRAVVFSHVVSAAGHNDIYGRAEFQQAMDRALAAVLQALPRSGR